MSKRYVYPQQYGERKKAKLNITVSDHNFPLSQNPEPSKDEEQANNTWGDDNDDEILLLASQACEDAYKIHNSVLPNYSMCMQPSSTSTQISEPMPSTSKTKFNFKMPTFSPVSAISNMRDNFKTISSPLPGISKPCKMDGMNVSEDIIFKDNIYNGKDSDVYRQLLKLQEENAKLKSENDKLLDKCVTKEGEASILRTQLKTCQSAVDNARIEKIKAQEKLQTEWSEKLTTVNNQVNDLRNQLDFKNLEVINMKEKCKMLESNKVNLTQITLGGNDINMSQRYNNSMYIKQENVGQARKVKTSSNSVQTDDKSHFLKLNIMSREREETSKLSQILPYIMERTTEQYSTLEHNEKLKQPNDIQRNCRIFSTFHRLPTTPIPSSETRYDIDLSCIYEDLSYIAAEKHDKTLERYLNIIKITKNVLKDVQTELQLVARRMTTAFQKEMDERYISSNLVAVRTVDLLSGRALYKEEQVILARRMICVLSYLLNNTENKEFLNKLLGNGTDLKTETDIVSDIDRICALLDSTTCAVLYSSFLTSVTLLLNSMATYKINKNIIKIIKNIIISRPMPFVNGEILNLLVLLSEEDVLRDFCCQLSNGNLKVDYDQGVLLYRKDSCTLQILLKQSEVTLKCIEKQQNVHEAVETTRRLLKLYSHLSCHFDSQLERNGCDCQLVFIQTIVFALRICAEFLNTEKYMELCPKQAAIISTCRSGAQLLQRSLCRAGELAVGQAEGWLVAYCQLYAALETDPGYCNMVSEIMSMYQVSPEELPQSHHSQAWLHSFNKFSIAD